MSIYHHMSLKMVRYCIHDMFFFLLEMLEKTMVFAPRSINISETYEHGRWEHACAASAFVSVSCDLSIRRCGKLFLA